MAAGAALLALLLLALPGAPGRVARADPGPGFRIAPGAPRAGSAAAAAPGSPAPAVVAGGEPAELECKLSASPPPLPGPGQPAPPSGADLGCGEEGWFVADFEIPGSLAAERYMMPLSRSICCRPVVPDDLAGQVQSVLSVGCFPAAQANPKDPMMCPYGFLVTGFEAAEYAGFTYMKRPEYFPTGSALCCQPAALMRDGEVREIEPCSCRPMGEKEIGCGVHRGAAPANGSAAGDANMTGAAALQGFMRSRAQGGGGGVYPLSPASCCNLCFTERSVASECEKRDCNGHGICIAGRCSCVSGWGGENCEVAARASGGASAWIISLVLIFGMGVFVKVLCSCRPSRLGRRAAGAAEPAGDAQRPLLAGDRQEVLFSEGEVDSDLSSDSDSDAGVDVEAGAGAAGAEAEAAEAEADEAEGGAGAAKKEGGDKAGGPPEVRRGLTGTECSICMSKPVEVVAVPCGHACMCKKCARRCRRCPICREMISRRQQLFVTS